MVYKCDECGATEEEKESCCGTEMTEEREKTDEKDEDELAEEFEKE